MHGWHIAFPGLDGVLELRVGHREASQAGLGLGASPGSPFIADLAARTGGSAWKRRNGRGVVMRFHLHQGVHGSRMVLVDGLGRSEEHTSELQSLMRISYAVFCLKKKKTTVHDMHSTYECVNTQEKAKRQSIT